MHYTRVYAGEDRHSYFEVVNVPVIEQAVVGGVSQPTVIRTLLFGERKTASHCDFYNAPARQFIVLLDGEMEITTSLGEVRRFSGGDVLLVEDTTGFGHKTENVVQCICKSLFITL